MILFNNIGNSCYLNSVLQLLLNQLPFLYYFANLKTDSKTSKLVLLIQHLVKLQISNETKVINPFIFKRELAKSCDYLFNNFHQQDAHEAVVTILDIIHETTKDDELFHKASKKYSKQMESESIKQSFKAWKETAKKFGYSFITDYFTGQIKAITICDHCNHRTTRYENFNNLTLQIPQNNVSVVDCIKNYIQVEKLPDYKCDHCNKRDTTRKRTTLWKFPTVLIICFKRFDGQKRLNFEIEMEEKIGFQFNNNYYNYNLTVAIDHIGHRANSGHYTALLKRNGNWYIADDESVHKTIFPKFSKSVYIACYYITNCLKEM